MDPHLREIARELKGGFSSRNIRRPICVSLPIMQRVLVDRRLRRITKGASSENNSVFNKFNLSQVTTLTLVWELGNSTL